MGAYGTSVVEQIAGPTIHWKKRVRRWRWVPFFHKEIDMISPWGDWFKSPYSATETMRVINTSSNGWTVERGGACATGTSRATRQSPT